MKRKVATPLGNATCVITGDPLDRDSRFVLPCCSQDIARTVIVTWLKQSTKYGCPCCRDNVKARDALGREGYDLTEIVSEPPPSDGQLEARLIFESVLAGISEKRTIEKRCQEYQEFGLGLMDRGHYRLAHDLIEILGQMMTESKGSQKLVIAKTLFQLLQRYSSSTSA